MKNLHFLPLILLLSCVETGQDLKAKSEMGCVVYQGYDQRWFQSAREMNDGTLEVVTYDGKTILIKNYSGFECY